MSLRNSVLQQETDEGLGWVGLDTHWSLLSSSGIEFPVEKRTIMVVHLLQYSSLETPSVQYRVTHPHQPREIARAVSSTCLQASNTIVSYNVSLRITIVTNIPVCKNETRTVPSTRTVSNHPSIHPSIKQWVSSRSNDNNNDNNRYPIVESENEDIRKIDVLFLLLPPCPQLGHGSRHQTSSSFPMQSC